MNPKNKKIFLFLLTTATLITLITISTHPTTQANKITVDGTEYLTTPNTKINIKLEYQHSVELTKITEEYEVAGCEIKLVKFTWPGHGAGLPSKTDETPSQETDENMNYVARNIKLNTTLLKISMKHRINPKLTINGEEVESREEVVIETCTRASLIELITSKKLKQPNSNT